MFSSCQDHTDNWVNSKGEIAPIPLTNCRNRHAHTSRYIKSRSQRRTKSTRTMFSHGTDPNILESLEVGPQAVDKTSVITLTNSMNAFMCLMFCGDLDVAFNKDTFQQDGALNARHEQTAPKHSWGMAILYIDNSTHRRNMHLRK